MRCSSVSRHVLLTSHSVWTLIYFHRRSPPSLATIAQPDLVLHANQLINDRISVKSLAPCLKTFILVKIKTEKKENKKKCKEKVFPTAVRFHFHSEKELHKKGWINKSQSSDVQHVREEENLRADILLCSHQLGPGLAENEKRFHFWLFFAQSFSFLSRLFFLRWNRFETST